VEHVNNLVTHHHGDVAELLLVTGRGVGEHSQAPLEPRQARAQLGARDEHLFEGTRDLMHDCVDTMCADMSNMAFYTPCVILFLLRTPYPVLRTKTTVPQKEHGPENFRY